ncbi:hypothetical protein J6590_060414 [Homalodisca vitripennis]|nr:hypothetical protein J6590_060414 [Homalodisca vitripennis]
MMHPPAVTSEPEGVLIPGGAKAASPRQASEAAATRSISSVITGNPQATERTTWQIKVLEILEMARMVMEVYFKLLNSSS